MCYHYHIRIWWLWVLTISILTPHKHKLQKVIINLVPVSSWAMYKCCIHYWFGKAISSFQLLSIISLLWLSFLDCVQQICLGVSECKGNISGFNIEWAWTELKANYEWPLWSGIILRSSVILIFPECTPMGSSISAKQLSSMRHSLSEQLWVIVVHCARICPLEHFAEIPEYHWYIIFLT